jgi:two-component system, sensor histidine kinase LadS
LLAAVLISAICALWLRQWFFVVATAYALAYGAQHLALNGYDQFFLYPTTPMLADRVVGILATLVPALSTFFVLLYLEPRAYCPRLTRLLTGFVWVSLAASGFSLAGYYPYLAPHIPAYVVVHLALMIALLIAMGRYQPNRVLILLVPFLPGSLAILLQMLRNLGVMPANFWTTYLWALSVFLQMPVSTLIILQRVREEEHKHRNTRELALAQRQLLDMVAHELRTPLAVVETTLANIEARTADLLPDLRPRFQRIDLALVRLNMLVDNALAEERLSAGSIEIHCDLLAPSVFLRQIHDLAGRHDAHSITLTLPVDDRPIPIDAHWLGLAVLNLINNAIKYSPGGGAVDLAAERVNHHLAISVRDHGIGIAPDAQALLGTRFFRAENAQALPGVRGMGLGLYLVRQVVERHGGKLRIESQPGQGSCFCLEIPDGAVGP